jgi:hypothetical protein
VGERFLGMPIDEVTTVNLDELESIALVYNGKDAS